MTTSGNGRSDNDQHDDHGQEEHIDDGDGRGSPGRPEERSFAAGRTGPQGEGGGSMSGRGQEDAGDPAGASSTPEPYTPRSTEGGGASGLATSLQPGGTLPAGGPGAAQGGLGTGGGSTAGGDSGAVKRGGR